METKIKKIEEGLVELSVVLNKEELNKYVLDVEEEMLTEVTVDGFRKGKAPREVARQKLDHEEVRKIALQTAVSDSLQKTIADQSLDVAMSENLKINENTDSRLAYSVCLKNYPSVELPNLSGIKITVRQVNVSEKEVKDALGVLQNMRSVFTPKDGPAQIGDRVEVDFEVKMNGISIEGGESKNHPLIIGGKNFMPGFEDQLVGLKIGEEKAFSVTAPKDYYQKKLAGQDLDFKARLCLIQSVKLPELDDAFAQTAGSFKSLQELTSNITEGLREEKKMKERERVRIEILDTISKHTKVNIPKYLIEEQLDTMIDSFDRDLHSKGLELPMYLAQIGKKLEDVRLDWRSDAEKHAKRILVIRAYTKKEKIEVSQKEIDDSVSSAVQALSARNPAELQNIDMHELQSRIGDKLLHEKALQSLESRCIV